MVRRMTTSDNEWQRVRSETTSATNDNEWQMNDKEWQKVIQRVTTSDTATDNEWQRMTTSGTTNENEWEQVKKSDLGFRMKQNM